jgi:hypothetical protein
VTESARRLKTFGLFANARAGRAVSLVVRRAAMQPPIPCGRELVLRAANYKNTAMVQTRRILTWLMLIALAALVSYVGFRGYLTPEMLFNFANAFYC